ncbi:MAG: Wzt carbohydrate-binding domain-containing protein, partial [Nitrospirota bacterium]|nr:Wzt carbohydrate-binding domain-containing protein [Nitrospirota bacterium]
LWLEGGRLQLQGKTSDVIARYLTSQSQMNGVYDWPEGVANPGITEFKLFSIRVLDHVQEPSSNLDATKPFFVEIRYEICKSLPYMRLGFALSTVDGTVIFETQDADHEQYSGKRRPGTYTMRCEIPGELLTPGRYLISVNAGMPEIKNLVYLPNLLALEVEDTYDSTSLMTRTREGVIRPKLKWEEVE